MINIIYGMKGSLSFMMYIYSTVVTIINIESSRKIRAEKIAVVGVSFLLLVAIDYHHNSIVLLLF
jgi:hypothetical protein